MTYIFLIIGFVFLIYGAKLLVDGSSSLAKKLHISNLVIGLTIVAFGTSAPELFINLFASLKGTTDIAIGNIVGSNIVNIFLILGISSAIYPLKVSKGTVWKEIPMSLLAALLIFIMANDTMIDNSGHNYISRGEGMILIAFFIIFLYYISGLIKNGNTNDTNTAPPKEYSTRMSVLLLLLGLLGLIAGGQIIINSSVKIATALGLSSALIGLTIVAIGTSLPELATSAVAAYKKNSDIAVGNVIGSNIFNIFWILGISAIIKPLPFTPELNLDLLAVVAASVFLFLWMFLGKRHTLERWQGITFILIYVLYIVIVTTRG